MRTRTIKLPITVLFEGEYRAPGTPITLSAEEAEDLITRHGLFDENPAKEVPSKQRELDAQSVASLNEFRKVYQ